MTKDKLVLIGQLNKAVFNFIPELIKFSGVYQSKGLIKHIEKRHPDCVGYLPKLANIMTDPDYIGINPNERNISVELIKMFDKNVQIGIKLDVKGGYLYVATLYTVTDSKLKHRLESGRIKPLFKE